MKELLAKFAAGLAGIGVLSVFGSFWILVALALLVVMAVVAKGEQFMEIFLPVLASVIVGGLLFLAMGTFGSFLSIIIGVILLLVATQID